VLFESRGTEESHPQKEYKRYRNVNPQKEYKRYRSEYSLLLQELRKA
jgi:hypothetical protein